MSNESLSGMTYPVFVTFIPMCGQERYADQMVTKWLVDVEYTVYKLD